MSKSKQRETRAAGQTAVTGAKGSQDDEELLHVPKWTSGWRFYLMLGLMVFVLIIFVVPDQFIGLFQSPTGTGAQVYARWEHPEEGTVQISLRELTSWRREIDDFFYAQGLGRIRFEDTDLVRMLLMIELARSAGIYVSDRELGEAILQGAPGSRGFGSKESYLANLRQAGISAAQFEDTLRKVLIANRFQGMLASAIGFPDMAAVERAWKASHPELAFDYATIETATLADDPQAAVPSDEELKAWYDGLEEIELRQRFRDDYTPETIRADVAVVPVGGDVPEALLAAHPGPEGVDPEAQAREYYDLWTHVRFKRPEQKEDEAEARNRLYFPYEEVADEARREAPIYHALDAWRTSLGERLADGEAVDFVAEATELGLSAQAADEGKTVEQWRTDEAWGGDFVANHLSGADRTTGMAKRVTVQDDGLYVVRVVERVPSQPPPFADVRDRVAEEWQTERTGELAVERLNAVRAGLGERPDDLGPDEPWNPKVDHDTFVEAVTGAGYEAHTRDWYDPRSEMTMPVVSEDPVRQFFRFNPLLSRYEEDEVPPAELSFQGDHAFLLRAYGQREPEQVDIGPDELAVLRQQAGNQAIADFSERELTSLDWFRDSYGLWINPEYQEDEEPAEEEPTPAS